MGLVKGVVTATPLDVVVGTSKQLDLRLFDLARVLAC